MKERLAELEAKIEQQNQEIAKFTVQKNKIDQTSNEVLKELTSKEMQLKGNQSILIELQREDCRQTMAVDTVEIVDNIDKGYWRRQGSSSEEEDDDTESEAMSMPKQFAHLD